MKNAILYVVLGTILFGILCLTLLPESTNPAWQTRNVRATSGRNIEAVTWSVEQSLEVPTVVPGVTTTNTSVGSGFCIMGRGAEGKAIPVIWTAAHVISYIKKIEGKGEKEGKGGKSEVSGTRTTYDFGRVDVVRDIIKDGEYVGEHRIPAKVVRCNHHEDIAILVLPPQIFPSAKMGDVKPPELGAKLWHCGSMLGPVGRNSLSELTMAFHGRLRTDGDRDIHKGLLYDQATGTIHHGSSGGGVFLKDIPPGIATPSEPVVIGMIVEFLREDSFGCSCYIPVRRLKKFVEKNEVRWALGGGCDSEIVPSHLEFKE